MPRAKKQRSNEAVVPLSPPPAKGWKYVRFDEIARNITDRVDDPSEAGVDHYVGLEHLDSDSLKIRRWGTPEEVEATKLRFRPGDIIFGRRRAYQRKVAVAEFDGICSAHAMVLRAEPANIVPELLPYFMQTDTFMNRAVAISKGSLSPTINWPDLAKQQFALPADRGEQRRLAEVLAQTDETQEKYRAVLGALQSLEDAFVSQEVLGAAGAGVATTAIGDGAEVAYGLTVNANRRTLPDELPYLRVANVQRNALDLADVKMIGVSPEDEQTFALRERDLLVVEGHADPTEIGRAAIWRGEIDPCLHQNHILRIRCGNGWVPEFVLMYLNSLEGRRYFRRHAKSTSGLYTINSSVLRNIRLPRLSPARQGSLVERYRAIETRRAEVEEHVAQLARLKGRLLAHLLTPPAEGR